MISASVLHGEDGTAHHEHGTGKGKAMTMQRRNTGKAILLLLFSSFASMAAFGQSSGSDRNIRVTIEVGRIAAGKKASVSSYTFVTPSDGTPMDIQFGSRVPIPTTGTGKGSSEGASAGPMPSFTYQNTGMQVKVRTTILNEKKIKLVGSVEGSIIQQGYSASASGIPPTMSNLDQGLNLLLKPGSSLRAATIDDPGEGSVYLDVKADYLD
jgi:hypothetical protein